MSDSFISVKEFGAVGDGITNDTISLQNALAAAQTNGKVLLIPEGTYKYTETLNVDNPGVTIMGTNSTVSILLFDPPVSTTPPIAIQFKASMGSLSNLTLMTPRTKASASVRNEIGIQLHYEISQSGQVVTTSSGQIEFRELKVKCFDINFNIFGGWNRTFTNCEIVDGKTAGIKYAPLESGWSCSGDVISACNIVGNGWTASNGSGGFTYQGSGIYLEGAYQMNIQNCVFEYNGKAFDIRNSPDVLIINCWNEANANNSVVRQSARFVGGYNFTNETVEHLDCSDNDIVWFDHQNEILACNNNEVIFSQEKGYITKGIAEDSKTKNLIYNPKFKIDGIVSFEGWFNGGFGSSIAPDPTKTYNGAVSCYINMTAQRVSAAWTSNIPVTAGNTYTVSVASFYDGSIGIRDGFGVCLEYRPSYTKSEIQSILPTAINSWEINNLTFVIPENVSSVSVFFIAPNGGRFWFTDPIFVHSDTYIRNDIKFSYGTSGTKKYVKATNSTGETLGYIKMYNSVQDLP